MPPAEDARLILELALRHERSLRLSLDPAFPQENWGFLAHQEVENLLKAWIVLQDRQVPLIHDLRRLAVEAGVALPSSLLALETFAVRARYSAAATELPEPRERLLERLEALRRELERAIEAAEEQER